MSDDSQPRIRVMDAPAPNAQRRTKSPALGRGLQALLGESRREEPLVAAVPITTVENLPALVEARAAAKGATLTIESGLANLPIAQIEPHPEQPRRHFDDAALDELAASIAARGVIQPVIVRPMGDGRFQLVAGERRWRAAQRAQLHEIPALVRKLTEREVMALALIENLQREDLNPIEEARAYQRLAEQEGMTQADIARMVDKSRSHVANIQRLLVLPDPVIALVEQGDLSMGHARALIGAEDAVALAHQAVDKGLSVRDVESLIRKRTRGDAPTGNNGPRSARPEAAENADIAAMQTHLEEFLGLSVKITADADPRSGAVTIRYRTLDQLDLVCQRLTGGGI